MGTSILATFPLQLACQIMMTGQGIGTNGTSVSVTSTGKDPYHITQPVTLPQGYIAYAQFNAAYKIYNETSLKWNDARKRCMLYGGHLAVLDTPQKVAVILDSVPKNAASLFIGIHSPFHVSDEWVRVDNGLQLRGLPWATKYPDGSGHCLAVWEEGRGLWDAQCNSVRPFICEIPLP